MANIKKETAGMFFLCFRIYPVNECVFPPFTLLQNVKWVKRAITENVFLFFFLIAKAHMDLGILEDTIRQEEDDQDGIEPWGVAERRASTPNSNLPM
jgi:hypothetical protein